MSPENRRKFNTFFGSLFLSTGLVAWAVSAYYAVTPNPPKPVPIASSALIDLQSCRSALASMGFQATMKSKNEVSAFEPLGADPQGQLQKASVAATLCNLPMKSFCMGEGCEQPGLTLVIEQPVSLPSKPEPASTAKKPAAKPEAKKKK